MPTIRGRGKFGKMARYKRSTNVSAKTPESLIKIKKMIGTAKTTLLRGKLGK